MKKLWIVAADKKEIPRVDELLNKIPASFKNAVEFHECGIGLFESAWRFGDILETSARENRLPDGVILAGTAGSPNAEDIFKINLAEEFINPRFVFEELPEFLPDRWKTTPVEFPAGINPQNLRPGDFVHVPVYSAFGISKGVDHLAPSMAGAWENMEALSLSYACHKRQIPFMALLCCTNQICPEGRAQWRQNYLKAGELLFEALSATLLK